MENMESEEMFSDVLEFSEEICGDDAEEPQQEQHNQQKQTNLIETNEKIVTVTESTDAPQTEKPETGITDRNSAVVTDHQREKNSISDKAEKSSNGDNKLTQLPLSKIRSIMKLDPDFQLASHEAVYLITKATELFIESLAKESYSYTVQAKKKILQKRDVDLAIGSIDSLMFLDGAMNF